MARSWIGPLALALCLSPSLGEVPGGEPFVEHYADGTSPPRLEEASPRDLTGKLDDGVPGQVQATGILAPAPGQPRGALTGRLVFMSGGHGWTYDNTGKSWITQRAVTNEMVEDYGNLDQMALFAAYCFNAGATVIPFRPIGNQNREVVLDNDSPGVSYQGVWTDSASTVYYGKAGQVPYRFAALVSSTPATATATYTPNLPVDGNYPVYSWVRHGADRTLQLYRILHTGGESTVRVPHDLVGNGWVYLGTYFFRAGQHPETGAVVISNEAPDPAYGAVVIADAIRFGNGMGSIVPEAGATVSGYPREEEASRYWVAASLGSGQSTAIYDTSLDDASDNVGTPPRMAREMNREAAGTNTQRVLVSFHSNAGGGRGVLGLYNNDTLFPGTATPHQLRLATLLAAEINADLSALPSPPLEAKWNNRGANVTYARSDYAFGEIRHDSIGGEMDATIVEVAFHDNLDDARLMRDPKVRAAVARSATHALVRYMSEFSGAPLVFAPEPPQRPRVKSWPGGDMEVSWDPPGQGGGNAQGFRVYRSFDGHGFGQPLVVSNASATTFRMAGLPGDRDVYFRVSAFNAGGESMPSEVVGCRHASDPAAPRVLVVNAFARFDRFLAPRQTPTPRGYAPPGPAGTMDRLMPARMNGFDYVVAHGQALHASGMNFDSCSSASVADGAIELAGYPVVIWAAGRESSVDETFSGAEQTAVRAYSAAGGHLFVSGSEIAWDLDRGTGPTATDRSFLREVLHGSLNGHANDRSGTAQFTPAAGSAFASRPAARFDDGTQGTYFVDTPDVLTEVGLGTQAALNYVGGRGGAAGLQYDGTAGGGRVVYWGFPFETVIGEDARADLLFDVLRFFDTLPPIRLTVSSGPGPGVVTLRCRTVPGQRYQLQCSTRIPGEAWADLGAERVAPEAFTSWTDSSNAGERFYRVVWIR